MEKLPSEWTNKAKVLLDGSDDLNWGAWSQLLELSKQKTVKFSLAKVEHNQLLKGLYETILYKFPLLENVWVEYADFLFRTEGVKAANSVFECAFGYLPRSLTLWLKWCNFRLKTETNDDDMLRCYERARLAIGDHYLAWDFYSSYLDYLQDLETRNIKLDVLRSTLDSTCSPSAYHKLLRLVIQIPLYEYARPHELNFKLLEKVNPSTIRNFINPHDLMEYHKMTYLDVLKDEAKFKIVKASLKKRFTELYIVVQYAAWKRHPFEKDFLTTEYDPDAKLTRLELNRWREYLEFAENSELRTGSKVTEVKALKNTRDWIDVLYHRCTAITGNYHFFWIKWANFHLNLNDSKTARNILTKALLVVAKGFPFAPENLRTRVRLIDLLILDQNFEQALKLCVDIVGSLASPSGKCIIEIWIKILEIVQLSSSNDKATERVLKVVEFVLANCSHEYSKFHFLSQVMEFGHLDTKTLQNLVSSQNFSQEYINSLNKILALLQNTQDVSVSSNTNEGWRCEWF